MKQIIKLLRHPLGITLVILLLLAGGFLGLRHVGWPFYKEWRESRWLTLAEKFHQEEDLRSAGLVLRKIVTANPSSIEAWELILTIAREEDGPTLPFIYSQVAMLKPTDEKLHYDWAAAAIRRGDFAAAATALEPLDGSDTATYHRLAATIALATENFAGAEEHFVRLLEFEPHDEQTALNLSIVRLHLADDRQGEQARQHLTGLAAREGEIGIAATRALLTDAAANGRIDEVLRHKEALRAHPDLTFGDRLRILDALNRYHPDGFDSYLAEVMERAEPSIALTRALARFLNRQGQRQTLRQWLESLPEEVAEDQVVNLEYIETLVFLEDLPALEARLRKLPWEQDDFYRHAILAHTLRHQNREREAREMWQRAVIGADQQLRDQRILYLQARNWGWESEQLDLLNRIFYRNPREQWAFVELFAHYQETRNTPELTRLFSRHVEVNPNDLHSRNNLAYLWLLQETTLSRAHALASEIYSKDPANPLFRTTYAFSLYRQGRYKESLQIFEEMEVAQRNAAPRALHYGLILAANGDWQKALEVSAKMPAKGFFPEEDRLMERLKVRIAEHL